MVEVRISDIGSEYREGCFVPSLMKRFWQAQLTVLREIDRICQKYSLTWYASWGTCLGAVRHKGFIPWDDDLDINMPRKDYEAFKKYCAVELKAPMVLGDVINGGLENLVSRVVNTEHSYCLEQSFLDAYFGCPYQAGVDIFCVDHIPDDPQTDHLMCQLVKAAYNVGMSWEKTPEEEREEQYRFLVDTCGIQRPEGWSIKRHCLMMADRVSAMYMDEKTEYSAIIYYYYDAPGRKMPTDALERIIRVPFEDFKMPILQDYESYLTNMFGDWRKPVKWREHPYLTERVEELRGNLQKNGQELPAVFDLEKEPGGQ